MAEEPRVSQEATGSYIAQATGEAMATVNVYAAPPSLENQNRIRFLVRLRTRYRELLFQSLHGAVRMTLELAGHPDAVAPLMQLLYETDQQSITPLPANTSLLQVYQDAGHELLMLGEPGAGKSTLLLELALDLVKQAEQDPTRLFPMIVPLSSWASKRPSLEQWLSEQITLLYDLPRRLVSHWVQEERLLPLLDGLDEMEEEARSACIEAINAYHREHLHPLVVASRSAEYAAAATKERLILHSAVIVQPLTKEQVDTYLEQCGEPMAALRTALQEHTVLQEIATTPLMLNILILTYQGQAIGDLPVTDSLSDHQRQIFSAYVQRMIKHKGKLAHFSQKVLISSLGWLARQMRERNQTIFYLEHLQPDWLPAKLQHIYRRLAIRFPGIVIGTLVSLSMTLLTGYPDWAEMLQSVLLGGLLGELLSTATMKEISTQNGQERRKLRVGSHAVRHLTTSILIGLLFGGCFAFHFDYSTLDDLLKIGCTFGAIIGLSCWVILQVWPLLIARQTRHTKGRSARGWQTPLRLMNTLLVQQAILVAVVLGGGYELGAWLSGWFYDENSWSHGPLFGLITVLISLLLSTQANNVQLSERLRWSWRRLLGSLLSMTHWRRTSWLAGIVALTIGLVSGGSTGWDSELGYGIGAGLSVGLNYWLLLGIFQGTASERIEDDDRQRPNQGIYHSIRNGLFVGLVSSIVSGLIGSLGKGLSLGLSYGLSAALSYGLEVGLNYGLSGALGGVDSSTALFFGTGIGLLACLIRGGLAALRHYIIRLLLARSHSFPWHAPRFLEEATARILLRRVGGGYSFPHRLLLDYFADLPNTHQDHPLPPSPPD